MTKPYTYRAFGLIITSELEIPGGVRVDPSALDADIVIRIGGYAIGTVEAVNGPYSRYSNALLFDATGIAAISRLRPTSFGWIPTQMLTVAW